MNRNRLLFGIIGLTIGIYIAYKNTRGLSKEELGKETDSELLQLYHTSAVSDSVADKFMHFYNQGQIIGSTKASMQIDFKEGRYILRMPIKDDKLNDPITEIQLTVFGKEISNSVFNRIPTDIIECDSHFEQVKVLPFSTN